MNLKHNLNIQSLLWLALALALIGSLKHLAAVFASVDGNYPLGWLQAIAIDAGVFSLSYSLRGRKEAKRGVKITWLGIGVFTVISVYGNLAYGFFATTGQFPDWITVSKPYVLAASLPVLVLYLAELLADDRQHMASEAAKEEKKLARQAAKEAAKDSVASPLDDFNSDRKQRKQEKMAELATLRNQHPDASITELATLLEVSRGTVRNYLTELASTNGKGGGNV